MAFSHRPASRLPILAWPWLAVAPEFSRGSREPVLLACQAVSRSIFGGRPIYSASGKSGQLPTQPVSLLICGLTIHSSRARIVMAASGQLFGRAGLIQALGLIKALTCSDGLAAVFWLRLQSLSVSWLVRHWLRQVQCARSRFSALGCPASVALAGAFAADRSRHQRQSLWRDQADRWLGAPGCSDFGSKCLPFRAVIVPGYRQA